MSAYICDKDLFVYLIGAALSPRFVSRFNSGFSYYHQGKRSEVRSGDFAGMAALANELRGENVKSVWHRYGDKSSATLPGPINPEEITERDFALFIQPDPVQVLKTIACLRYQSCEHPGWEDSEAYAILSSLEQDAIGALPGYDDAEWGPPRKLTNAAPPNPCPYQSPSSSPHWWSYGC